VNAVTHDAAYRPLLSPSTPILNN